MSLLQVTEVSATVMTGLSGPAKLSPEKLRGAQRETLTAPRMRRDPITAVLVAVVNLIYGRRGSLAKFKVLELLAPLPYQSWERAAYRALTRFHRNTALTRRVFDAMVAARAQQDNEAFHLLILSELLDEGNVRQGFFRYRLLPRLLAAPYRLLCWTLLVVRPAWSYRLNASFESHAEQEYMAFVAEHPELEVEPALSAAAADYGFVGSVADLLRQIGHDERIHKMESLDAHARAIES
jgi:ubiquinol oxidase